MTSRARCGLLMVVLASPCGCSVEMSTHRETFSAADVRAALSARDARRRIEVNDREGTPQSLTLDDKLLIDSTDLFAPLPPSPVTLRSLVAACGATAVKPPYRFDPTAKGPPCALKDDRVSFKFERTTSHHVVDRDTVVEAVVSGLLLGGVAGFGYCLDRCDDSTKKNVEIGAGVAVGAVLLLTIVGLASATRAGD